MSKAANKPLRKANEANAENNHNLDVDRLFVKEAHVGRTMTLKRFHARGRGKSAGVEKPFANITIIVSEKAAEEKTETKKAAKKGSKDSKKAAAKTDKK